MKEGYLMNQLLIKLINSNDYLKVYGPNQVYFPNVIKNFKKSYTREVLSDKSMDDEIAKIV